jgi:hypothetical protein
MGAGDEVLLNLIQDAPDPIGSQFTDAVGEKNAVILNHLVHRAYPHALWGKYFNALPAEDRAWVMGNLNE